MAYEKKTVQEYITETEDKTVEGFNDNQEDRIASEFDDLGVKVTTNEIEVGSGGAYNEGLYYEQGHRLVREPTVVRGFRDANGYIDVELPNYSSGIVIVQMGGSVFMQNTFQYIRWGGSNDTFINAMGTKVGQSNPLSTPAVTSTGVRVTNETGRAGVEIKIKVIVT